MKLAFFYDQSVIVRDSVRSVWEAIGFGLVLSVLIILAFLRRWGTTLVATLVIPVTILITLVVLRLAGLTFNLMTLGGIAAAVGLVIDDAIVVVEAIHAKMMAGVPRLAAVQQGVSEIFRPLVGSTLTPVVVFVPLAFLDGITGVFFRSLALTMVSSLLTSLVLAMTLTPALAMWLSRAPKPGTPTRPHGDEGAVLRWLGDAYEWALGKALRYRWLTILLCLVVLAAAAGVYTQLQSDFLPPMDEGGFVIDYFTPPGTSLSETNRELLQAEAILQTTPEVESYSRRTGARLALAIAEPNTGDFLVKLHPDRTRSTDEVIASLRAQFTRTLPGVNWDFPGILTDLIGDLMWAPEPIEVKFYSTDPDQLKAMGPRIEAKLQEVPGVVDTFDGLTYAGTELRLTVRPVDAQRLGFTSEAIGNAVNTAMLGNPVSTLLEGDREVTIRTKVDPADLGQIAALRNLPIRSAAGSVVHLSDVADVSIETGQLELRREDLRQDIAVTARLENRDLGSAMADIQRVLAERSVDPARRPRVRRPVRATAGLVQKPDDRAGHGHRAGVHGAARRVPIVRRADGHRLRRDPVALRHDAGALADRHVAQRRLVPGRDHRNRHRGEERHSDARLRRAFRGPGRAVRRSAGPIGAPPAPAGADDLARGGARDAAAGLRRRIGRGHAAAARHRRHGGPGNLRPALAGGDADGAACAPPPGRRAGVRCDSVVRSEWLV